MSIVKRLLEQKRQEAQFHYDNCELEYETDEGYITSMWCDEHKVDVTECLPEYEPNQDEPDPYDNSEENIKQNES